MPVPEGLEGAKGVLEKLPGIGQLSFFMRVLAPGALAAALLYPFTGWSLPKPDLSSVTEVAVHTIAWLAVLSTLGVFVSIVLGDKLYELFEGRSCWPARLLKWATDRQTRRVEALRNKADQAADSLVYDEVWATLRTYPLAKNGQPFATRPTRLGNILYAYEDYPQRRYEMDAVFYWTRIWLALDKDRKADIDSGWSVADGLLALSAVSFAGGGLWIAASVARLILDVLQHEGFWLGQLAGQPAHLPFGPAWRTALGGLALLVVGYLWYRLSLPFHEKNGEIFKAVFDLYRDRITAMTRIGGCESAAWNGTWAYLQWLRVRCMRCNEYYAADHERCDTCYLPREQSLELLRRSAESKGDTS